MLYKLRRLRWKDIRRGIKYPILIALVRSVIFIFLVLPRKASLSFFGGLSNLLYHLLRAQRVNTIRHLTIAFGKEKSPEEIKRMARMMFVHQGWNLADLFFTSNYRTWDEFSRIMDVQGLDILEREYKKGKGILCLVTHTGSWEFSAITPPLLGFETTAVSKRIRNPQLNDLVVGYREKRGMKNISRGGAYPKLLAAIEKGECIIIMIDQDTIVKGVYVDFFGKTAFTPVGLAQLALDTGVPVVPMSMRRQPNHRHLFTIHEPLPTISTGNLQADLEENTRLYNKEIERIIRLAPEQWVWMHERWHTTPDNEKILLNNYLTLRDQSQRWEDEDKQRALKRQQKKEAKERKRQEPKQRARA